MKSAVLSTVTERKKCIIYFLNKISSHENDWKLCLMSHYLGKKYKITRIYMYVYNMRYDDIAKPAVTDCD